MDMTERQIRLVKECWEWMYPSRNEIGGLFYRWLFSNYPELRGMFHHDMQLQAAKFTSMMEYLVSHLDTLYVVANDLIKMAVRHSHYGTVPAHYEVVEKGLITVFKDVCAEYWNDELQEAWHIAIDNISKMMMATQAQIPGP